jgi:hypothetical protein
VPGSEALAVAGVGTLPAAAAPATRTPADPAATDAAAIAEIVALTRLVPDRYRRFASTDATARSLHRIDAALLERLIAAGLPVLGSGPDRLFDDYDLANSALHLGLLSVRRRAMRAWAGALARVSADPAYGEGRRVEYVPTCPTPGHPGECSWDLLVPGGIRVRAAGGGDGRTSVHRLDAEVHGGWPDLPDAAVELLQEVRSLKFFLLPEAIRWDVDFVRRTGLGDCGSAAKLLITFGQARGIAVRFAFGLLAAKPYSTPHCWTEFEVDGHWAPADPLLLDTLRRVAGLPSEDWPAGRSAGGLFVRLGDHFTRVAVHDGLWASLSLPTEVTPCST